MMKKKNRVHRKKLYTILFLSAALQTVVIPFVSGMAWFVSLAVEQAMAGGFTAMGRYLMLALILALAEIAIKTVGGIWVRQMSAKCIHRCKLDLLAQLLSNPLYILSNIDHGTLVENLNNDQESFSSRFTQWYPTVIASCIAAVGYSLLLFLQSPLVAGSLILIALMQLIPPVISKKYMQLNYDDCRDIEADITDHVMQAVDGFETIKLYDLKAWWQGKMAILHKSYLKIGRRSEITATAQIAMFKLLENILKYGTYALLGVYVMMSYCSLEVALQAVLLSGDFFESVKVIFSGIPQIAVSRNAEKRIQKWQNETDGVPMQPVMGYIVFSEVCCKRGEHTILDKVSLTLDMHENYLFEGANGAGKSTLFQLITGALLPNAGTVLVGGEVPNRFYENVYPEKILYITQSDPEFDFCAQDLLEMFDAEHRERIYKNVARFGLAKERMVSCAIRELSGGERKKVFLSIGFGLSPELLLLDEPTNSLDSAGKGVLNQLVQERSGSTWIISHDLALRELVDAVYTVEDGGICYAEAE